MSVAIRQEIESLREELERHNRLYYVAAAPEISDLEFDRLLKKLEALEREHPEYDSPDSPTHKVGGAPISGFQTVAHRVPMISIENVYSVEDPSPKVNDVRKFDRRIQETLGSAPEYTIEYKIDGVALALVYEHGRLVQAVTRGDGQVGDDVTHNARTIRGVPLRLHADNPPPVLEIRGEAVIANSDFAHIRAAQEKSGEEPFKNTRNATAGALKSLDPQNCEQRKLRFFAHGIGYSEGIEFASHIEYLDTLRKFGVPTSPCTQMFPDIESLLEASEEMMERLSELDFEVDGLVIKVNQFAQRQTLGQTSKAPRWVIAYKWERYEATTKVRDITIQVGKTGALTPVANLEPVEIAQTTVSRASLHNLDEVRRLGIRIGDTVVVEKAGKIIPHVVRVEEHKRDGSEIEFVFPTHCPECGADVLQDEGGVYVRCQNPSCPAQLRETLRFFASRSAMDIEGLGIKLVETLVSRKLLTSVSDIYRLKDKTAQLLPAKTKEKKLVQKTLAIEPSDVAAAAVSESDPAADGPTDLTPDNEPIRGLGEKSVDNLLAGIEATKQRPLWRLLTGLNIRHVGQGTAQLLANKFGTLDKIMSQSAEELSNVDEVGPVIARSVHAFLNSEVGRRTISELRDLGLHLGQAIEEAADTGEKKLAGKTLVVTGTLERFTRDEIKEFIQQHGGKASGSVSKTTDYLVAGRDAGSKLEKAESLGVPILTETELIELVK